MKKLLVVSTTFFPHPVVGAIRITEWCKRLPEFGWQPTVLARHHGVCASPQELTSEVHPQVQVHYLGTRRPAASNPGLAPASFSRRNPVKQLTAWLDAL